MTDPLSDLQARAARLADEIDNAPDESTARRAADELHRLLDDLADVAVLNTEGTQ